MMIQIMSVRVVTLLTVGVHASRLQKMLASPFTSMTPLGVVAIQRLPATKTELLGSIGELTPNQDENSYKWLRCTGDDGGQGKLKKDERSRLLCVWTWSAPPR